MPTTGTINTQQLIQMGTHTEKLQQTLQHLPTITSQQVQDEQIIINETKQIEVQELDHLEATNPTDPEGKRRREVRLRRKDEQVNDDDQFSTESSKDTSPNAGYYQGHKINITIYLFINYFYFFLISEFFY